MKIVRATKGLAGLVARLILLPPAGEAVATSLSVADGKWTRDFDGFRAVSDQFVELGLIWEKAGPLSFGFRVVPVANGVDHLHVAMKVFGVKVPLFLGPRVAGGVYDAGQDDAWVVKVEIGHALLGQLVTHEGTMRKA